jgi:uncharacterized protein (TIGR02246 family)
MSREAIDKGHAAFMAAMRANDAEALGRLVTSDAVFMPPHEQPVAGRQGIIDWFAGAVKQARTASVEVPAREVIVSGDLAIELGSFIWKLAPTTGGSPIEDRGNFLVIWQRQPDGSWKARNDIWNSTLPVPR